MFVKQYGAYIIVLIVITLNILIHDNVMIPLVVLTVMFTLIFLIGTYRENGWVKQILKLF